MTKLEKIEFCYSLLNRLESPAAQAVVIRQIKKLNREINEEIKKLLDE